MRAIGIDLAFTAAHKAVVLDEQQHYVTPVISFHTRAAELDSLLAGARQGADSSEVQVVMEPTGMAWFPIAVYLEQQQVPVYLVNCQEVSDLRKYYQRHAKSDRIDARVLAQLPSVNPEHLHRLTPASAKLLACQRGCKELDRLSRAMVALQNRLHAIDRFAWPELTPLVFKDPFSATARWFREHWYDPAQVLQAGASRIRQNSPDPADSPENQGDWATDLVRLAHQVVELYGTENRFLHFEELQAESIRLQATLAFLEGQFDTVRFRIVRPLYRQLHPSRNLETIKGIGQDSAAVYLSFIGDPQRFQTARRLRGWSGMVPNSKQSAHTEAKGLHITQAGPALIKKYLYLDAEIARQWDPQLAALYYDQMVNKGKHHLQAICTCATHLLDRIRIVLRDDRPYELRDVQGQPVTVAEARAIIMERYTVPEEVRQRTNKRTRHERAANLIEKQHARQTKKEKSPKIG